MKKNNKYGHILLEHEGKTYHATSWSAMHNAHNSKIKAAMVIGNAIKSTTEKDRHSPAWNIGGGLIWVAVPEGEVVARKQTQSYKGKPVYKAVKLFKAADYPTKSMKDKASWEAAIEWAEKQN